LRSRVPGIASRLDGPQCLESKGIFHDEAEREQWDDGNNVVALEPGVVVAYDRNTYTNTSSSGLLSGRTSMPPAVALGKML
jgi:hypothetical protein